MNNPLPLGPPAVASVHTAVIKARCSLRTEGDQRVVVAGGLPMYRYRTAHMAPEAYAMTMLVDTGFAQKNEAAHGFGNSEHRHGLQTFRSRLAALERKREQEQRIENLGRLTRDIGAPRTRSTSGHCCPN